MTLDQVLVHRLTVFLFKPNPVLEGLLFIAAMHMVEALRSIIVNYSFIHCAHVFNKRELLKALMMPQ